MIIDVHAHLGEDCVFDIHQDEAELLTAYDRCGVDKAVIQPFVYRPYLEDMRASHDRIAAFCKANPGRIYGMASINPHFRHEDYEAEAERCIRELGFVGLKITTIGTATRLRDRMSYFRYKELDRRPSVQPHVLDSARQRIR